jgi:hypothetical protein
MLMDPAGRAVKVETTESAVVREGQQVTVEGILSLTDLSASSLSRTVAITEARIVSSSSGRKKETPSTSAMPASRKPRQQPTLPVQPPQKSPNSEGRIF